MLAFRFRQALAVVLCFAGGLAYWFGYYGILEGRWFGEPFGWGFGAAATIALGSMPLIFDRDDPTIARGIGVPGTLIVIILAAGVFGASVSSYYREPMFFLGAGLGGSIGALLSYWGFGEDRKKRGVPRTTSAFGNRQSAPADYLPRSHQ